jgi:guanyl-specific ribonuclease Sa
MASELDDDKPDEPESSSPAKDDKSSRDRDNMLPEYERPEEPEPSDETDAEQVAEPTSNEVDRQDADDHPDVPDKAVDTLEHIDSTGEHPPGYRGGDDFENDGRRGGEILPENDADGNPIEYQEWDVKPYQKGVDRGEERIVTGSDNSAYYTSDHYDTFTRMR